MHKPCCKGLSCEKDPHGTLTYRCIEKGMIFKAAESDYNLYLKFIIIAFSNLLYVIEPSSLHGCRGPDEIFEMKPCESCCIQDGKDCIKKSRDCALECGTWYNTRENLFDQRCPYGCPKCASCLLRDEEQLMSLKPPEQCNPKDCKTMEIGIDPCFAPGCECFCSEANRLMEKCPDVKPDWLPG